MGEGRRNAARTAAAVGLALMVSVIAVSAGFAGPDPRPVGVAVDGRFLELPRAARIEGGTLYVPARATLESAGVRVSFSGTGTDLERGQRIVTVNRDGTIGVAGQALAEIARYDYGLLFVPVRAVAEALGLAVSWVAELRTINLITPGAEREQLSSRAREHELDREDILLIARMVEAEAYGEPYEGKVGVAAVILNRVRSASFPATVSEVIFQRGQFATGAALFQQEPRAVAIRAALDAAEGWDPTAGAIYFFNPYKTRSAFLLGREAIIDIGLHRFAR